MLDTASSFACKLNVLDVFYTWFCVLLIGSVTVLVKGGF